jgi:hypothetical protein
MSRNLTILHFNILEKYPPALNIISDALAQKSAFKISVITSVNNSPYKNQSFPGVKIFRLGSTSKNAVLRYTSYLSYNFIGTLILLLKRPDVVLVYETLSVFPAYVYSLVFTKKRIHIHYHEYVSIPEKEASSRYVKVLFKCEEKLLQKYTCSQTNEDRKQLFLKDNAKLKKLNVFVFPNMPPKKWWKAFGQTKKLWDGGKIKLVYVGVLDTETMYLKEVLQWVRNQPNELELTLISQDVSLSARKLISNFESENIVLKTAIDYTILPQELVNHDIGLVMYKGHIPNYVYNVPNKVYEYLFCGLMVIGDRCLISTEKLNYNQILLLSLSSIENTFVKIQELMKEDRYVPSNEKSIINIIA